MKINVFKRKRRILYAIGLVIGVLFNLSYCIVGLIFQPDPILIGIVLVIVGFLIFIIYSTIKKGTYHGEIDIDEVGVSFSTPWKHTQIDWKTIKYITIHENPHTNFIGFFTDEFKNRAKAYNKPYATYWMINLDLIDETFIFVEYRKEILDEVKQYWSGEIINEKISV